MACHSGALYAGVASHSGAPYAQWPFRRWLTAKRFQRWRHSGARACVDGVGANAGGVSGRRAEGRRTSNAAVPLQQVSAGQEQVRGVGDLGTDLGTGNILHLSLL